MVRLIGKNNPNRWFYAKIVGTGEDSLKVFGYVGPLGKTALETGLPILVTFLTEEESGIYIRGLLVKEEE
jgi:hypothetical protein